MALTYIQRRLDTDGQYLVHNGMFNDAEKRRFLAWDRFGALTAGVLKTSDGQTWSTLFTLTSPTDMGTPNEYDGKSIIRYGDSIFVSLHPGDWVNPTIVQVSDLGVITKHLVAPSNNYISYGFYKCFGKLWAITDFTPFFGADGYRRVVYFWNGTAWTAITNYGGAAYLNYNINTNMPGYRLIHRCTQLLFYNGELYLFASRYSGAWGMEVWKLNQATCDRFTLVYSEYNGWYFCGAVESADGELYVSRCRLRNGYGRNETNTYRTTDLATFSRVHPVVRWEDEFDIAGRDPAWIDTPHNGSITEAAGICTTAIVGGVNGAWGGGFDNAPVTVVIPSVQENVEVRVKLNNYTVNDRTAAGLYITDLVDGSRGYQFSRVKNIAGGKDGLRVLQQDVGYIGYINVTTLPIYLRMRITGSGTGHTIYFEYSIDETTWTQLASVNDYVWRYIGIFATNWPSAPFNAISVPFEYFVYYNPYGFPTADCVFGGVLRQLTYYDNGCNTDPKHWTQEAYSYNPITQRFSLDAALDLNIMVNQAGGLGVFTAQNLIMAGKYREIYGATSTDLSLKQMRRKQRPMVAMEVDYKDRLGNKFTERVAPIDARAPTRFYHGRLSSISSLTRSIDSQGGLYKPADATATLVNSDRRYSKLLARYIFKNQEARLYHLWCDEPENFRKLVITMLIDDHPLSGPSFELKLKDRIQPYFAQQLPGEICASDYFTGIHPDYNGKSMPEILGLNEVDATHEKPGAVKAVYINTTSFYYLAAARGLSSIPQVYSAGVLVNPANYNLWGVTGSPPSADGRSYIQFLADQGNNEITFNCTGYSWGVWDSPNGYVQNPAYILEYFLRFIAGIPAGWFDQASFDDAAAVYDAAGRGEVGRLIMQDPADADEWLRQLLFSFGLKCYIGMEGKIKIGKKDIYNWLTDTLALEQVDAIGQSKRDFGLTSAVNREKIRFNYYPWQQLFLGAMSKQQDNFYDADMEDDRRVPIPQPV
jgi:hypothetical protein